LFFKLFRIEENLEKKAEEITTLAESLAGLREEEEARPGQSPKRGSEN